MNHKGRQTVPKLHGTGVGAANGNNNQSWTTSPISVAGGKGWGLRLTGDIRLTQNGTYTFPTASDDGLRLWIDDTVITDDWNDGTLRNNPGSHTFVNTQGDSWHRVRLDYYNKNATETDAHFDFNMIPPGGSNQGTGSSVKARYGLATTNKVFDSTAAVGDTTTASGREALISASLSIIFDRAGGGFGGFVATKAMKYVGPFVASRVASASQAAISKKVVKAKTRVQAVVGGLAAAAMTATRPTSTASASSGGARVIINMDRIVTGHYGLF